MKLKGHAKSIDIFVASATAGFLSFFSSFQRLFRSVFMVNSAFVCFFRFYAWDVCACVFCFLGLLWYGLFFVFYEGHFGCLFSFKSPGVKKDLPCDFG